MEVKDITYLITGIESLEKAIADLQDAFSDYKYYLHSALIGREAAQAV